MKKLFVQVLLKENGKYIIKDIYPPINNDSQQEINYWLWNIKTLFKNGKGKIIYWEMI